MSNVIADLSTTMDLPPDPDPCVPNPCQHGTCVKDDTGATTCACDQGYTGPTCGQGKYTVVRAILGRPVTRVSLL